MKGFLYVLLFLLAIPCFAQELDDPLDAAPPQIIVQTGIGFQWFNEIYRLSTLSVERPMGHFWQTGLHSSFYFDHNPDYYDLREFSTGFDIGVFAKYFMHGRFSGRKSGLYWGPELRFGSRRTQFYEDNVFPLPPNPIYNSYKLRTTKFLLRWGVQWKFNHAILDLSAPFGMETSKSNAPRSFYQHNETHFVLLPTLQLGYAF